MFKQDVLANYTDADGLVASRKCSSFERGISGNGVLYTAEFVALLSKLDELTQVDKDRWLAVMAKCLVEPGLLDRGPIKVQDQEGPDDYVGYAVGAYFCNPRSAGNVLDYGWRHLGIFNDEVPGTIRCSDGSINWSAFLFIHLDLVALYYFAAGRKPCWFLRVASALSLATDGLFVDTEDAGSRLLSWMKLQVVGNKDWMHKLASKIWLARLKRQYPGGMKDVAAAYFEKDHPFIAAIN